VNDPNHFDRVGLDKEEYFVGKSAGQNPPHVSVEHRMMQWMVTNIAKGSLNLSEKLLAQAGLPFFVPVESLGHVRLGFWPDDNPMAHFRREVMRA
jgi:hypothetical protein